MAPLREFRSLDRRYENDTEVNLLRRFYLIFEGVNTEKKYFYGIDSYRKEIGINSLIEIVILNKEDEIRNYSNPKKLLELINLKKDELKKDDKYDDEIDRFVIVFDRDSFEVEESYLKFIDKACQENIIAVTSPCFEIWLLLHYEEVLEKYIYPNKIKIIENKKVSSTHSYISKLCSDISGVNPKNNVNFSKIRNDINMAIEQEKSIVQNPKIMFGDIGSNIGILIEDMKKDPRNSF
ncbi:MAG: RloB family protein [Clostridiales bacterium]